MTVVHRGRDVRSFTAKSLKRSGFWRGAFFIALFELSGDPIEDVGEVRHEAMLPGFELVSILRKITLTFQIEEGEVVYRVQGSLLFKLDLEK